MYSYGSSIAHGDHFDFKQKRFDLLKSHRHALKLINETTKAVLRQALEEPRLVVDLKNC